MVGQGPSRSIPFIDKDRCLKYLIDNLLWETCLGVQPLQFRPAPLPIQPEVGDFYR